MKLKNIETKKNYRINDLRFRSLETNFDHEQNDMNQSPMTLSITILSISIKPVKQEVNGTVILPPFSIP